MIICSNLNNIFVFLFTIPWPGVSSTFYNMYIFYTYQVVFTKIRSALLKKQFVSFGSIDKIQIHIQHGKGVYAINERGYRLTSKIFDGDRYYKLLLRLQGENGKTRLIPKNVKASIQTQKVTIFDSDRKQFNLIPNISVRYLYNL